MQPRTTLPHPPRVLIVDDDKGYCEKLASYLAVYGCETACLTEPEEFEVSFEAFRPNILLLDQRLGATTGTEVLRRLREQSDVPCIVVTGMPDPTDRVVNLEVGADDEVDKSTSPRELLARIRAVLRRSERASLPEATQDLTAPLSGWTLSRRLRELRRPDGSLCRLTTAEFETLLILQAAAGKPVRRVTLCERVFGRPYRPGDRAADTVVKKLRQKLEPDQEPRIIKTVRPLGYVFTGFPAVEE